MLAGMVVAARPARAAGLGDMLWEHTLDYLRRVDEKRSESFAALKTPEDLEQLRRRVKAKLEAMWGPLPSERTPLNSRHLGTIERPGYRIEKIIFESRPNFFVTANLYRPAEVPAPLPALLFAPGQSADGKGYPPYQRFCARMARLGFVVLTWDPVAQGERRELDEHPDSTAGVPGVGGPKRLGRQCYLLGRNLMHYRAWDTIRALDYLETRTEVDAGRIAMAGHSGGGAETLQLACYDPRIKVAVPMCAVAGLRDLAESLIPVDPEQILYGALQEGIDHPELLASFAPGPLMIGATAQDFLPLDSVRRTYAAVARTYGIVDATSKATLVETPGNHALTPGLQEAAAAWLVEWCAGPAPHQAPEIPEAVDDALPAEQLYCAAAGRVANDPQAKSVLSLNQERARQIAPRRGVPATRDEYRLFQGEIAQAVRDITRVGQFREEVGIYVPDLTLEMGPFVRGVALVVSDLGKDHPLVRRALVDPLAAAGYRVVALDLRGWGESAPDLPHLSVNFSWDDYFAERGLEFGRPMLGQRMKDLLSAGHRRAQRSNWILAGVGAGALVAAHAAVLDSRVSRLITVGGLLSYRSLVDDPFSTEPFSSYLPGVIGAYDVRDLYAALAPRPVLVVNPTNARRVSLDRAPAWEQLDWTAKVYESMGAPDAFSLETKISSAGMRQILLDWLKK